jgi:hypothetical protein
MDAALSKKIAELSALNKTQLLPIWRQNFDEDPPPKLRKELMVPILAYRMQERAYGGLSHSARKKLRDIAASLRMDKLSPRDGEAEPQTGTRLIRSWHGEVHEVIAIGSGYLYRGQNYSSLSRIAREITGTRWSGPLFFGTRKA